LRWRWDGTGLPLTNPALRRREASCWWITWLPVPWCCTIGCVIVMLMKGPAYVADAYELNDSDRPT